MGGGVKSEERGVSPSGFLSIGIRLKVYTQGAIDAQ